MLVMDPPVKGFAEFVQECGEIWRSRLPRHSHSGVVLVELIHNNATALCMNLLVGCYVAEFLGARPVGFTAPTFTKYPVPMDQVRALAAVFGVKEVINLEQKEDHKITASVLREWKRFRTQLLWRSSRSKLSVLDGDRLRAAVLELNFDGVWIGDLVYDSYLYPSQKATINEFDSVLAAVYDRANLIFAGTENLIRRYAARAMVVSHTVYVEYGLPSRVALRYGIPVFGKAGLNPVIVRKYRSLEEATIPPRAGIQKAVSFCREALGDSLPGLADAFYPPSPGKVGESNAFRYGYGSGKREEDRSGLIRFLGLDPKKKTCCIMAHMFVDAPHACADLLFADYYQWLAATLSFVARTPSVNWLVPQHPYEILVGQEQNFQEIVAPYVANGTVTVVPDDVTTSSLFSCVDAVTTCSGTAGIEFASVGIPCILAAKPYYADYSFAPRPRTQAAYFKALSEISTLPRLSADEMNLAKEIAYVELKCLPVRSALVPETPDLAGLSTTDEDFRAWWLDVTHRFKTNQPCDDPLYQSLHRLVHSDEDHALEVKNARRA